MCDPLTALTVGASLFGINEQRRAANRQQRALNEAAAVQQEQINDDANQDINERYRRARSERARLRALSAESGLTGVTIESVLNNVDFQAGTDSQTIEQNRRNRLNASRTENQSRLNSIRQPDYLGAGLQIANVLNDAGALGGKKKSTTP